MPLKVTSAPALSGMLPDDQNAGEFHPRWFLSIQIQPARSAQKEPDTSQLLLQQTNI
ncbi:hypothetical protein HED54_26440 [Ochrobactrum anthropi ATCC 49188]|nr:hypothetical protein [Brucella anthropi ATCC 49188]